MEDAEITKILLRVSIARKISKSFLCVLRVLGGKTIPLAPVSCLRRNHWSYFEGGHEEHEVRFMIQTLRVLREFCGEKSEKFAQATERAELKLPLFYL